ncbi:YraN family protein [Methylophaga sp.]|uniref:YraN family protein n=1 Tax=Methylophaga sp. TaxID=2024840 RepID=UPI002719B35A|nr:YraN family protein [Methylophaga sp.]MDO8827163.1 YraN family protein [Methylophaga sp.]
MAEHLQSGKQAEQLACDYLLKQGLKLIQRNFHCRRGEIDLIMQDGQTLVFVEVRYRRNDSHGGALESITSFKQSRIITTAQHYLMQSGWSFNCRFDVIAISAGTADKIVWIRDAFQLN